MRQIWPVGPRSGVSARRTQQSRRLMRSKLVSRSAVGSAPRQMATPRTPHSSPSSRQAALRAAVERVAALGGATRVEGV